MSRDSGMISVVVPCYNEEAVLYATHARLGDVLDELDRYPPRLRRLGDSAARSALRAGGPDLHS
jgi:hypothetical protein